MKSTMTDEWWQEPWRYDFTDYYAILAVPPGATDEVIQHAYQSAKLYDGRRVDSYWLEKAYEVLSESARREKYDLAQP